MSDVADPITLVRMGTCVLIATPNGMTEGLIVAADASARIGGSIEFMVGVECGNGLLWRTRSEVYKSRVTPDRLRERREALGWDPSRAGRDIPLAPSGVLMCEDSRISGGEIGVYRQAYAAVLSAEEALRAEWYAATGLPMVGAAPKERES